MSTRTYYCTVDGRKNQFSNYYRCIIRLLYSLQDRLYHISHVLNFINSNRVLLNLTGAKELIQIDDESPTKQCTTSAGYASGGRLSRCKIIGMLYQAY